ncbi:MAG TPA: phosphatidylserine decarboxylase [Candidatus Methylomirabilis sp.]|nr:phosphatidylserine decarboxylase [Candidatus Methylomirabilis sp.]
MRHQFIDRFSGAVRDERLYGDRLVNLIYSRVRENSPRLFRALTSMRISDLLGRVNYDLPLGSRLFGGLRFLERLGVDLGECLDPPKALNTARKVFERRIRYWECRPMPQDPRIVVSPADAKVLVGSLNERWALCLKDKFFTYEELLGRDKHEWLHAFQGGDYAIFRLTPEKYHYNHTPVAGRVLDFYAIDGSFHSCNPGAVVALATPYSKNRRYVTIIDTDVEDGTRVGLVAMIEIVALMIGEVVQVYSELCYDAPQPVQPGVFLRRGAPKSLYRPGSSTDVLLFQRDRVHFDADIVANMRRQGVASRFTRGFRVPLVETDLAVRSSIGRARSP